jgi:hypothetical protein
MPTKNLLIRNNSYDGVRLTITGTQSGDLVYNYTEASGNRYYFTPIGSTASPSMESATFNSFLTFTMSGATTYQYNLIPMSTGETAFIEVTGIALNSDGTKGYMRRSFGGYRHSGSALSVVGASILNTTRTDFADVIMSFATSGTQSILLTCTGEAGETIDWDIHITYTKGFNRISSSAPPDEAPGTIYPEPPLAPLGG